MSGSEDPRPPQRTRGDGWYCAIPSETVDKRGVGCAKRLTLACVLYGPILELIDFGRESE